MTSTRQTWPCLSNDRTNRVVERARANVLIFVSLLLGLSIAVLMALNVVAQNGFVWSTQAPPMFLLAAMGYIYYWCKTGRPVRTIAVRFVVPLYALAWLAIFTVGGYQSHTFFIVLIYPVIIAAVFGRREAMWAGGVNSLGLIALMLANLTGLIGVAGSGVGAKDILIYTVAMLVAQSVITVCVSNMLMLYDRINDALSVEIRRNKRLARESQEATKRFEGFTSVASDWLWEIDTDGICTFVGGRFMATLVRDAESFVGQTGFDNIHFNKENRGQIIECVRNLASFRKVRGTLEDDDGKVFTLELSGRPILGEDGEYLGMRGVGVDITEKLQAESRINYLAAHDELTGLLNRASITDHLKRMEQTDDGAIMLMIDLDGFKGINDAYGHAAGDEVLREVSRRLTAELRANDLVGRLGGDEFVIVLPYKASTRDSIDRLCERLLDNLSQPFHFEQFELVLSGSIGIAYMPDDAATASELFVAADLALYAAKEGGRSRSECFDPELQVGMRRRVALEKGLRKAIQNGDLHVAYQPQYGLDGNTLIGFEALARWDHPEEGPIRPDIFIGVAETCGLISELERQILRRACSEAVKWPLSPHDGKPLRLAVNISAVQFNHGSITADVSEILAETGLDPSRLELEITESLLMQDTDKAIETLEALHALGVTVAVDDFGTGYSSLSYLQRFPLSRLKIDRSFVKDICVDEKGTSIANAVVQLGHGLGLTVIAEGVETEDQRSILINLGCDEVQGFLYSKPVTSAGALKIIVKAHKEAGRDVEQFMVDFNIKEAG